MSFVLIEHDLEIALRVVEKVTVMHNGSGDQNRHPL
jgi:branched-chain amino acid transport system ATP-binding protein